MVTQERAAEVRELLGRARRFASRRPDIVAAGLVGSWARDEARMDSDVDLILLTTAKSYYLEGESWTRSLGGVRLVKTVSWGPMTERRFALASGLEVEAGIAPPSWAATDPVDPNLVPVIRAGLHILYDPEGLLERLLAACGAASGYGP